MATETFLHEQLYRGADLLQRLGTLRITLCGAGALGSNLADTLARQGAQTLRAIDHDRIEAHNIGTQLYTQADVGSWKVESLRKHLFRATGIEIDAIRKELTEANARTLLKESDLILDCFDNSSARTLVQNYARAHDIPTLHIGLHTDYCEVVWDENYRIPRDIPGDVCDYPLARNLVLLAVVIASEGIMDFLATGQRASRTATLRDLAVIPMESA
jgi:molybdopterin/thiamine biosynthesis adenylyltransferase